LRSAQQIHIEGSPQDVVAIAFMQMVPLDWQLPPAAMQST
jgi:hypothetical protein